MSRWEAGIAAALRLIKSLVEWKKVPGWSALQGNYQINMQDRQGARPRLSALIAPCANVFALLRMSNTKRPTDQVELVWGISPNHCCCNTETAQRTLIALSHLSDILHCSAPIALVLLLWSYCFGHFA